MKRRRRSCQIVLLSSSADQRSPSRDTRKVLINIVSLSRGMQEVCRVKDATLTGALAAATPPAWKTRKYSCGKQDKKIPQQKLHELKCEMTKLPRGVNYMHTLFRFLEKMDTRLRKRLTCGGSWSGLLRGFTKPKQKGASLF